VFGPTGNHPRVDLRRLAVDVEQVQGDIAKTGIRWCRDLWAPVRRRQSQETLRTNERQVEGWGT